MQRGPDDSDCRTPEQVDAELGQVFVASVKQSRRASTLVRLMTVPVVFDIVLSVVLGAVVVDSRRDRTHDRRVQVENCRRFNEANKGQLQLWGPILSAPRPPLSANATAAERRAYDDSTRARESFERNLHRYFDPVKC